MAALAAYPTQITLDGPFFALSNNKGNEMWGEEFFRIAKGELGELGPDGLESDLFAGIEP
jgi:N-acetyl-1-D-myo-inositol-2-amino-2-deoxy-alpha-D-glucopyranoside deacetylase